MLNNKEELNMKNRIVTLPFKNRKNGVHHIDNDIISEVLYELSVQFSDGYFEGNCTDNQELFWECFKFINKDKSDNVTIEVKYLPKNVLGYYELSENPFLSKGRYSDKQICEFLTEELKFAYEIYPNFYDESLTASVISDLNYMCDNWDDLCSKDTTDGSKLANANIANTNISVSELSAHEIDTLIDALVTEKTNRNRETLKDCIDKLNEIVGRNHNSNFRLVDCYGDTVHPPFDIRID